MLLRFFLIILLSCLAGCAARYGPSKRVDVAQSLAAVAQWDSLRLEVPHFEFMAFVPMNIRRGDDLTIYIEGDGLAWLTPTLPSMNPTPINPVGLKLALAHPVGQAAYLGRPCQYLRPNALGCDLRYWTEERFSPEVVSAMSAAVDRIKSRFSAHDITLVGYSGGGAIAVLLAAKRNDVRRIVTIAGNLDTQHWIQWHELGELTGSINPADLATRVSHIPQWHFVGGKDANITPEMVRGFASRLPALSPVKVLIKESFNHSCCWAESWRELWLQNIK